MIRGTARVAELITAGRLPDAHADGAEWYVNTVTTARRRMMLALHAGTLFPILATGVSTTELRDLPSWLATLVVAALADEPRCCSARIAGHGSREARKTRSHNALGLLNQMALKLEAVVTQDVGGEGLTSPKRTGGCVAACARGTVAMSCRSGSPRRASPSQRQLRSWRSTAGPHVCHCRFPRLLQPHQLLQQASEWQDRHLLRFLANPNPWDHDDEPRPDPGRPQCSLLIPNGQLPGSGGAS